MIGQYRSFSPICISTLRAIGETVTPPLPYQFTRTARTKKAHLTDRGPTSAHTASYWRLAEGMGNHDQGRHGAHLRTASVRLRKMEKGQGERLWSSLERLCPRRLSTLLVMAAQPAPGECRRKFIQAFSQIKAPSLASGSDLVKSSFYLYRTSLFGNRMKAVNSRFKAPWKSHSQQVLLQRYESASVCNGQPFWGEGL